MQYLIDTHAHLTFKNGFTNIDGVIQRAEKAKVKKIINICTDQSSLLEGIKLSKKYSFIYNAAATTPHDVDKEGKDFFPIVERSIKNNEIIAIGESGLDYYYHHSKKETQKKYLKKYFDLSITSKVPIILHCRDAFDDLFSIADEFKNLKAVVHCFTGSIEEAERTLDRGWYISFSGIVTFKKSDSLRGVLKMVPMDRMFIETDSPYLAPQNYRGERNEPSYIVEVVKTISQEKKTSFEEVAKATFDNAIKFFNID